MLDEESAVNATLSPISTSKYPKDVRFFIKVPFLYNAIFPLFL